MINFENEQMSEKLIGDMIRSAAAYGQLRELIYIPQGAPNNFKQLNQRQKRRDWRRNPSARPKQNRR